MKKLWAPWRMEYIKQVDEKGCFLCDIVEEQDDRANLLLRRGETCAVVINRYPYNSGHLLVAPNRHVAALEELTDDELLELMRLTVKSKAILEEKLSPTGFNIGINLGRTAGAALENHVHMHVVPRWDGDTNFMPVLADTKVIPQSLLELWDEIAPFFLG